MSSCGSQLEKVSSLASNPEEYDIVPEEKEFSFKINAWTGKPLQAFSYDLKAGKKLPYTVKLKGFVFVFSRELTPSISGFDLNMEDGFWTFEEQLPLGSHKPLKSLPSMASPRLSKAAKYPTSSSPVSCSQISAGSSSTDPPSPKTPSRSTCSDQDLSIHIDEVPADLNTTAESSLGGDTIEDDIEESQPKHTPHNWPTWLKDLKKGFSGLVVNQCSGRVRRAVDRNEKVKMPSEHRLIKNEIINTVLSHLKTIFTLHKLPSPKEMREIAYTLSYTYPAMFQQSGEFEEEGNDSCLNPESVDDLASKMKERLRGQLRHELKTKQLSDDAEVDEAPKKKGRTKNIYGVDQDKWHRAKKAQPEAAAAIAATNAEMEFEKREAVYEANRSALTAEFKSKKPIKSSCKGFWLSDRHLANHFMYATNSPPLNAKVEERIDTQFGHLEAFLMDQCKTVEFRDQMEAVKNDCEVNHSGSTTWKNVYLMRFASQHFDGGCGSELIRLESDGPPKDGSPHLLVIEVNKNQLHFEVWVEGQKLLGNLHLAAAISAFLHLCFCFDLHYPKGAETMSDLLQIGFAKYGDNAGTRTWKKAGSAEKKRDFYYGIIGRIAAQ